MAKRPRPIALPIRMTARRYETMEDEMIGICLNCGHTRGNVEGDADAYPCDNCHQPRTVHGVNDLLETGKIEISSGPRRGDD